EIPQRPQNQGETLLDYPKPIHKFHPRYHYPDCAPPIAGEDNDCEFCIPFRLLSDEIQRVKEQGRGQLADRHRNGWQRMKAGEISINQVHNDYYNPGPEINNHKQYVELRTKWNTILKKRIQEVDDYFAHQDCQPMDLDKQDKPEDPMKVDLQEKVTDEDIDFEQIGCMIIQDKGVEVRLEWSKNGIKFDHKFIPWSSIRYWQNKFRRETKDPIRVRSWKGPYATCWCIFQGEYSLLEDDQSCDRCEYWFLVLHYLSKLPNDFLKSLINDHTIHPWFKPAKVINQDWQNANFAKSFQVKLLSKRAIMPQKAHQGDAAWDIFAAEHCKADELGIVIVPTHIKLCYTKGHYGKLETKSSQALKGIQVLGGVLDEGFTGEIKVILKTSLANYEVHPGDKVAQLIIHKRVDAELENEELAERGNKGFGSSGTEHKNPIKRVFKIMQANGREISNGQKEQLSKLLAGYADIFRQESNDINTTVNHTEHFIRLTDYTPIHEANRVMPPVKKQFLKAEIEQMLKTGVISESPPSVPWGFQVVIVQKKDGSLRLCVDYRRLNQVTIKDGYPLPRIEDIISRMGKAKYFTSLDLASGYWQVPMAKDSKEFTTFICPYGQYYFNVMPFGLTNAPATFQRMMNKTLRGLVENFCEVYLDDILIYSETFEDHLQHIKAVMERLNEHGLKLKQKKCHFAQLETEYLGFILSDGAQKPAPRIIEAIQNFPEPELGKRVQLKTIQSYLGLCNFYRKFIHKYQDIVSTLSELLKEYIETRTPHPTRKGRWIKKKEKNDRIWKEKHHEAFQELKSVFQKTIEEGGIRLAYPIPGREYIIRTDASDAGIGAALLQRTPEGDELPIMYAHRVYHGAEPYYCMTDKEALAVREAVKKWFSHYVWGTKFKVYTDHAPLLSAFKNRPLDSIRLGLWIEELTGFDFELIHVPGKDNELADILSRCPNKVTLLQCLFYKRGRVNIIDNLLQDGLPYDCIMAYPELASFWNGY
ncbi:5232_t:CDS:1, partial [Paraglomus occultum]